MKSARAHDDERNAQREQQPRNALRLLQASARCWRSTSEKDREQRLVDIAMERTMAIRPAHVAVELAQQSSATESHAAAPTMCAASTKKFSDKCRERTRASSSTANAPIAGQHDVLQRLAADAVARSAAGHARRLSSSALAVRAPQTQVVDRTFDLCPRSSYAI
jgi:hypothetical protein